MLFKCFHVTIPTALWGMFIYPPIGAISLEIVPHHCLIPDVMPHEVIHPALQCHVSHEVAVMFTQYLALTPTTLQVDRRPCGINVAEHDRRAFCSGRRLPLLSYGWSACPTWPRRSLWIGDGGLEAHEPLVRTPRAQPAGAAPQRLTRRPRPRKYWPTISMFDGATAMCWVATCTSRKQRSRRLLA